MTLSEILTDMIAASMTCPYTVTDESNLYTDLGYDSLSFTRLLVRIEHTFSISFSLTQMHSCANVGALISAVEEKLKEDPKAMSQGKPEKSNEEGRNHA